MRGKYPKKAPEILKWISIEICQVIPGGINVQFCAVLPISIGIDIKDVLWWCRGRTSDILKPNNVANCGYSNF